MASRTALLILLNIVFFTMVSSSNVPCGCSTPKTPKTPKTPTPKAPTPKTPTPKTPTPKTPTPKTPTPKPPTPSTPKTPTTPSGGQNSCPIDTLRLGVCGNVLSGLINVVVGTPARQSPCCSLINGLADLDAAVCLCTAIRANILGINLNVPISLSLLLNYCGKESPSGFQCK